MKYTRVKGCYDIHSKADEIWKDPAFWNIVESAARSVAFSNSLNEIRTPVFEYTDVFLRMGETSDVVSKEMYTFEDKGGRSVSLRPEITAPVIRAFIENSLHQKGLHRFYYIGPCWRYDRAQKGRYRQFNQFGIEIIGVDDPSADIECISALLEFYQNVGLKDLKLLINTIGDKTVRKQFAAALKEHFTPLKTSLSQDSQHRLHDNPLRILDSKDPNDRLLIQHAPKLSEFLTETQKNSFTNIQETLTALQIDYTVDPTLVRGLDYYCDTVFEIVAENDTAAQNTLGAGGRYNGLIKEMGGPDLSGVGFATGLERVIQTLLRQSMDQETLKCEAPPEYYLIGLSETSRKALLPTLVFLRKLGKKTLLHQANFNIKKALTQAEKIQSRYAIILGEEELAKNRVKIKNLSTRQEMEHPITYLKTLGNYQDPNV